MRRLIVTTCQHCKRPITYNSRCMEWMHHDKDRNGEPPCLHAQPKPGWSLYNRALNERLTGK